MLRSLITIVAALFVVPSLHAADIYGGPTYDSTTGTGYGSPQGLSIGPGSSANNGIAVGAAQKDAANTNLGYRAFRWDATGAAAIELGNLGTDISGYTTSIAKGINATGTTVGFAEKYTAGTDVGPRAVRWDATGPGATELANLGTDSTGMTSSYALAINAAGVVVGAAEKFTAGASVGDRAVRWGANGTSATELDSLGTDSSGFTYSQAYAINATGTAVGFANKYTAGTYFGSRAVRWDATGTAATELGNLGTASNGNADDTAYAVNTAGTAVGVAEKYAAGMFYGQRAVRWDASGTAPTELDNLGTDSSGHTTSFSQAISADGTAVGFAAKYVGGAYVGDRAVRWDSTGTAATELGNLGTDSSGVTSSYALAINDADITVGDAEKYIAGTDDGYRAVAWGLDGVAIDLNTLLSPTDAADWTLTDADSISDANWIAGIGTYDPDGAGPLLPYQRAFLIQLPEPAMLPLLVVLATGARRRRQV